MECFFIQFQWGFFFCSSTTTYSSSWSSWPGWSDWSSWSDWSYRSYRSLPLPTQFLLLTTPEMPCTTKNGVWFCSVSFSFLISFWLHNQPSSVSVFLISVGSFLWVTPIHSKRKKKKGKLIIIIIIIIITADTWNTDKPDGYGILEIYLKKLKKRRSEFTFLDDFVSLFHSFSSPVSPESIRSIDRDYQGHFRSSCSTLS